MIKVTMEIIFHYTCSICSNWWSYATTDKYTPKTLVCPHCGEQSIIIEDNNNDC